MKNKSIKIYWHPTRKTWVLECYVFEALFGASLFDSYGEAAIAAILWVQRNS